MSPARPKLWPARLTLAYMACLLGVGALALFGLAFGKAPGVADIFFREQDIPLAALGVAFMMALRMAPAHWFPVEALAARAAAVRPVRLVVALAVLAAAIGFAGWYGVMHGYPLSTDEFMARFDAAIFREGRLYATVPQEWRFVRGPIQPQFMLFAPDGASWASTYLPTNAMALALFGRLGSPALAGAFWSAVAVAALYGVARRVWPERRDAALVAVVLLATSSQLLLTAMTPYSMSAHLALNLVWLWLFMREDAPSQAGALVVAFVACGLHQVVFHPLFALPFVAELWLARRWRRACLYTCAYLVMGVFWILYWKMALPGGPEVAAGGGAMGLGIWIERLHTVAGNFSLIGLGQMAKNLFRFVTWQNPVAPALAALALVPAIRSKGWLRPMAVGMVLMLALMTAIMPYQGHGWGYRYLHGFLGSLCLLAAWAWMRTTDALSAHERRGAAVGLALAAAFSLAVLAPLRALQARAFIAPYERAEAAIANAPADVVVVDPTGMFFASDLVRNDPYLRNSPKVVDLLILRESQIRDLCARYRVVMFDQGSRAGFRRVIYPARNLRRLAENRAVFRALSCADQRIVIR
jgi:hypothetical protein